jgi:cyclopropane-fatty-acyl-phospholipid synthase
MADRNQRQLAAARAIVAEIARHLQADLSVELWNGEVLPLGPAAKDDVRFVIRSPEAFRRMLRKPGMETLYSLYARDVVDIVGDSPLAASRRWDHMRAVRMGRNLKTWRMATLLWPFLFKSEAASEAGFAYTSTVAAELGAGRRDEELIQFHYDVSNDFFGLFLDPEMVYSAAYFRTPETSLEQAQIDKLDRICRKLRLQPGDKLLDIGCGWGALACHAARHYGANVHGVTLSKAQLEFAEAKVAREGLGERVRLELRDYRRIDAPNGFYDKIAQIEMFEHVGFANHDAHFETVRRLLKPRGLHLHQASVRLAPKDLARFNRKTGYMKAIDRYIFPGGELDYIGLTATNFERHGFEVHDIEALREHFALTTRHWAERLWDRRAEAEAEAGRARTRLWLLYLAMVCRAFERGAIAVFQTLVSRKQSGASGLPLARADYIEGPQRVI